MLIEKICTYCGNKIFKRADKVRHRETKKQNPNWFCDNDCVIAWQNKNAIYTSCLFCNKEIRKTPREVKKSRNLFCSRSCSAKYYNQFTKRKYFCEECKVFIEGKKKLCPICKNKKKQIDNLTMMEFLTLREAIDKPYQKQYKFNEVRKLAKQYVNKFNIKKECCICGYIKFVDLCHVKSISSFDLSTKLSEINCLENLTYLCPNHHKELDKNKLDLNSKIILLCDLI